MGYSCAPEREGKRYLVTKHTLVQLLPPSILELGEKRSEMPAHHDCCVVDAEVIAESLCSLALRLGGPVCGVILTADSSSSETSGNFLVDATGVRVSKDP